MLSTVWFNLLFLIGLILNVMLFHLPIDSNETSREKFGINNGWTAGKSDTTGGETGTECKSILFSLIQRFTVGKHFFFSMTEWIKTGFDIESNSIRGQKWPTGSQNAGPGKNFNFLIGSDWASKFHLFKIIAS